MVDASPFCPRMSSWKLLQSDAMVSYSFVIPRTSSSLRLRMLLEESNSSKPCDRDGDADVFRRRADTDCGDFAR